MTLKLSKDVSKEEMVIIRSKGTLIKIKDDNLNVIGYLYDGRFYIDDIDLVEQKEANHANNSSWDGATLKDHKFILENSLSSDEEIDGTTLKSITSSQLKLAELGLGLKNIMQINREINGLAASLWSYLTLEIQVREGKEDAKPMLNKIDKQIQHQLNHFNKLVKSYGDVAEAHANGNTKQ